MKADNIPELIKEMIKVAPEAWRDDPVFRVAAEATGWCLLVMIIVILYPSAQ